MIMKTAVFVVLLLSSSSSSNNGIGGVHSFTLPTSSTSSSSVNSSHRRHDHIINKLHAINGDGAINGNSINGDAEKKKRVVVIGNGMVGQRFMENLLSLDPTQTKCTIATFCEEPRAAYNRVKLTSYFETRDPSALSMTSPFDASGRTAWYHENNVELLLNDKAVSIDTASKTIVGASGKVVDYDVAVLATGSYPFVPPIPGRQRPGVFVYRVSSKMSDDDDIGRCDHCYLSRSPNVLVNIFIVHSYALSLSLSLALYSNTLLLSLSLSTHVTIQTIEDLEAMLAYVKANNVQAAAVIGGGLLGLEAAKAVADMNVKSHIIEFAPILMCRQVRFENDMNELLF